MRDLRGFGTGLPDPAGGTMGTFGLVFSRSVVSVPPPGVTNPTVAGTEDGVHTAVVGTLLGEVSDDVRALVRGRGTGLATMGLIGNLSPSTSSPVELFRLRGGSSGARGLEISGPQSFDDTTPFFEPSCC